MLVEEIYFVSDVCDRLKEKLLALSLSNNILCHCPREISCIAENTVIVTDHVCCVSMLLWHVLQGKKFLNIVGYGKVYLKVYLLLKKKY